MATMWSQGMWVAGKTFPAEIGRSYEVSFGNVNFRGNIGNWNARITVIGKGPVQWIDQDTATPIHRELAQFAVQAYREI